MSTQSVQYDEFLSAKITAGFLVTMYKVFFTFEINKEISVNM